MSSPVIPITPDVIVFVIRGYTLRLTMYHAANCFIADPLDEVHEPQPTTTVFRIRWFVVIVVVIDDRPVDR
jgi:hypothetical protein